MKKWQKYRDRARDTLAREVGFVQKPHGGRLRVALAFPNTYFVGMSNLVTFLERTEAYRRDLRRVEYGDERDPRVREFLERIAPLNHAAMALS